MSKESLAKSKLSCTNKFYGFELERLPLAISAADENRQCEKARKSGKRNVKRNTNAQCLQIQHCLDFEMK